VYTLLVVFVVGFVIRFAFRLATWYNCGVDGSGFGGWCAWGRSVCRVKCLLWAFFCLTCEAGFNPFTVLPWFGCVVF